MTLGNIPLTFDLVPSPAHFVLLFPMSFGSPPVPAPSSSEAPQLNSDSGCIDAKWVVAIPPPPAPQEGVSLFKMCLLLCVCVVVCEYVIQRVDTVSAPTGDGVLNVNVVWQRYPYIQQIFSVVFMCVGLSVLISFIITQKALYNPLCSCL